MERTDILEYRFHYMWQHLDLPFEDFKILPKSDSKL